MPSQKENVWDYPRPPRIEKTPRKLEVIFAGVPLAETTRAWRVLETSHPPVYYIPPEDIRMDLLVAVDGGTVCEWKGQARYWDAVVEESRASRVAWSYPSPTPGSEMLKDHLAFYAGRVDACRVDGERVTPQEGNFYGGWITSDLEGPFKGAPGTMFW